MKRYRGSLLSLVLFVVAFQAFVVVVGDLRRPPWGDEARLVPTVRDFAEGVTLDRLTHYEQLSTPLPFIAYAAWGRLVGFALWRLRLLSLLIAIVTYLLFHRLLWEHFRNGLVAFLATVFLAVHPYMVGFSIFVFTDGLTICFLVGGMLALVRRNALLLAIAVAGSLLCRQYAIFFAAAAIVALGWELLRDRKPDTAAMLFAAGVGLVPFVLLIVLWGGLSPVNQWRSFYATNHLTFHPAYLVLYVALLALYLVPVLLVAGKRLYGNWRILLGAFIVSWTYWFFPVKASRYALDVNVHTVGLFHKAMTYLITAPWFAQIIFFVSFALGLPILFTILRSAGRALYSQVKTSTLVYDLAIITFLVIMPFSYIDWEKYFVPLLPFVVVRLLILRPWRSERAAA